MNYILNQKAASDEWRLIRLTETDSADSVNIPEGKVIVPLAVWQAQPALQTRNDVGV